MLIRKNIYIHVFPTVFGAIQDETKLFASVEGQKYHRAKITRYVPCHTLHTNTILFYLISTSSYDSRWDNEHQRSDIQIPNVQCLIISMMLYFSEI